MIAALTIAFAFSYIGSIPPGSINLSVLQLAMDKKFSAALRFALAAALIEFPYAYIAVKFQAYLLSQPMIMNNIQLIAALVMLILGVINLATPQDNPGKIMKKLHESGFRKGLIISLLNPLAIPFWIGITAYLTSIGWIELISEQLILAYVLGVSLGTFALLCTLAFLGRKASKHFQSDKWIHKIPGYIFLILSLYAFIQYFDWL